MIFLRKDKELDESKISIIVEKMRRLLSDLDFSFIYDIKYIRCSKFIYNIIETNKEYIFDHKDVIIDIDHKMKDNVIGLAIKINGYYTINHDHLHRLYRDSNKIIENVLIRKPKDIKITLELIKDSKCYESLDKDINKIIYNIIDIIHNE